MELKRRPLCATLQAGMLWLPNTHSLGGLALVWPTQRAAQPKRLLPWEAPGNGPRARGHC